MAKQTFTTGQVLTAAQMTSLQQTAMLGGSASAKTANYTLVAADAGTAITMSNAGATTITVNTGLFAAGDTVTILNVGAGTCTITAGTATVSKPTNATLALVQNAGGVLYFTATGAATFMPFDVGTAATTASFVGCSVYMSADQNITNNALQALNWNTEYFDTDAFHSTSTNTSRFTVPSGKAGKYQINGFIWWGANTTGVRDAQIYKNGSAISYGSQIPAAGTATAISNTLSYTTDLAVGDYIEIFVYQNSGGTITAGGGTLSSSITFQYLGA